MYTILLSLEFVLQINHCPHLRHHSNMGHPNTKCLVDGSTQLGVTHAKLHFALLLWQVGLQKCLQLLCQQPCVGGRHSEIN